MARRSKGRNSASKYIVPSEELPVCPHVDKSITPTKVKNNFPHAVFGRCSECTVREKIYLCLKCGKQFCTTHADKHSDTNNHSLSFELATSIVRCSKCSRELPLKSHSVIERATNIIGDFLKKQNMETGAVSPKKEVRVEEKPSNGLSDQNKNSSPEIVVIEPTVSGLRNSGVICFFNSVLQNLIQTPMLRASMKHTSEGYMDTLHRKPYGEINIDVASDSGNSMVSKYQSFLIQLDCKERNRALHPYQVFQEMCSYNGCLSNGQQDAQEAFHAIVHSMGSEESKRRKNAVLQTFGVLRSTFRDLPKEKKKKINEFASLARNGTFIDHLFGGTTMNQITCLTCSSVTKTLDHFVDLSVPLPKKEEFKTRSKQKSSGEGGLSKHQKKKQQKENRKKGKKGRERQDGTCPSRPDSSTGTPNTEPNSVPSSPGPQSNGTSEVFTSRQNEYNAENEASPHVSDAVCSGLQISVEDISSAMNGFGSDFECEAVAVEEIQIEVADENQVDELVTNPEVDGICLNEVALNDVFLEESLCSKLENLVVDIEQNRKLKGGLNGETSDGDDDMFSGLFDQVEEPYDEAKSSTENLHNLMDDLDIDKTDFGEDTLDACLAQFCREELLAGDNQFSCMNCARHTSDTNSLNVSYAKSADSSFSDDETSDTSDAEEKIKPVMRDAKCRYFLNTLPPILVVHLKRFTQDHKGFLQKDRRHIKYPLELELDKFVLGGSGDKYKLFGVVNHTGSLHRGHYTAFVRKRDTQIDASFKDNSAPLSAHVRLLGKINAEKSGDFDKWYFCNDERISDVPLKRVINADAYLLFYERCQPYS